LVIRLSGLYTSGVNVRLKFVNIPDGKVLVEPVKSVAVINMRAQGFKLLTMEFFQKPDPIIIDLSRVHFHYRDKQYYYNYPLTRFEIMITEKYGLNGEFLSFSPDTIRLVLQQIPQK
jgi:hypothetical protein